jgi:hypothetical protein
MIMEKDAGIKFKEYMLSFAENLFDLGTWNRF